MQFKAFSTNIIDILKYNITFEDEPFCRLPKNTQTTAEPLEATDKNFFIHLFLYIFLAIDVICYLKLQDLNLTSQTILSHFVINYSFLAKNSFY